MSQKLQHDKSIQKPLRNLNIYTQSPKIFNKDKCQVNLKDFKNGFVVDVDQEINKRDSRIECEGKRCDFVLYFKQYCIFIEAKSGKFEGSVVEQLKNTFHWLNRQEIISSEITCIFLIIGGKPSRSARRKLTLEKFPQTKNLKKVEHIKSGDNIFKYLDKKAL